jgi:multicomponent Na+:H+ antiporter subunit E
MIGIVYWSAFIALAWVMITGQVGWDSLLLGYGIGLLLLLAMRRLGVSFAYILGPRRLFGVLLLGLQTLWVAFTASIQVAQVILQPRLNLHTGVIRLDTRDRTPLQVYSAISAHNISVAPGTLVIDIEDGGVLYVHCLNLERAERTVQHDQDQRAQLLETILGKPHE